MFLFIKRPIREAVIFLKTFRSYQLYISIYPSFFQRYEIHSYKKIIGDHQFGFERNTSNIDHVLCIIRIFGGRGKGNKMGAIYKLFVVCQGNLRFK